MSICFLQEKCECLITISDYQKMATDSCSTSDQEVVSISLPFESGFGQETCFDQEDSSKHGASRGSSSTGTSGLALSY